jgi:hypothetical protein
VDIAERNEACASGHKCRSVNWPGTVNNIAKHFVVASRVCCSAFVLPTCRYAWPLGSDGDTCCPGADVAAGFTVCAPANCPILAKASQLPANPFFATVADGKCACEAPQVCSA